MARTLTTNSVSSLSAGSPYTDLAIAEMKRLLQDPDHGVSEDFIYGLAHIAGKPEAPLDQWLTDEANIHKALEDELMTAVLKKRAGPRRSA